MTSLIFGPFSDDLYLLRWKILYTIFILPLATSILIPIDDFFVQKTHKIKWQIDNIIGSIYVVNVIQTLWNQVMSR